MDPAGVLVSGGLPCLLVCVAVSGDDMACCCAEMVRCEACCCDVCWMSCCLGCCCELGHFVADAAAVAWATAAVSGDVVGLVVDVAAAVVLASVTVENAVLADVVELAAAAATAAVALTSLSCGAVAACLPVESCRGSAVELVHVSE